MASSYQAPMHIKRLALLGVGVGLAIVPLFNSKAVAACAAPSSDNGTVTSSVDVAATASYRIWSHLATTVSAPTAYMLEVDGANCYMVNGSTVPVSPSGNANFFSDNSSSWVAKTTTNSFIDINLSTGSHSLKMIGTTDGVMLDRLVLTQDKNCVPTGNGDNCASPPDTTGPVVSITSPSDQATISDTTTVTANAVDDSSGVKQVVFYVGSTAIGTSTSAADNNNNYTATLHPNDFGAGSYALKAVATDYSGNTTTSSVVTIAIPGSDPTQPTPIVGDINDDGVVNYLDLSALASNYNKSGNKIKPAAADITDDGVVNYLDLSALASNYNH